VIVKHTVLLTAVLAATFVPDARAGTDARIREVAYDAASVVTVAAKPGVTTLVQFGASEHVKSVGTGQGANCAQIADPWCVTWPANAGFIYVRPKPRANLALALAVVTDRHAYSLLFEPVTPAQTRPAVFRLVFTYPESKAVGTSGSEPPADVNAPLAMALPLFTSADLVAQRLKSEPVAVNSNYSIAYGRASEELAPAMVFDDGRFTYLKWSGNREIPAVFEIRADGSEMVANTRMQGDLIVVDRIALGLMLRAGTAVASIRNDSFDPDGAPPVQGTTAPGVERAMKEPGHE
jgi:type IV secretion system protein VirB9